MNTFRVWRGWRAVHNGKDVSQWGWLEFDGELLGTLQYTSDEYDSSISFYRTVDGWIVIAEHRFGDWNKYEYDCGVVTTYRTIEDAAKCGWFEDLVRVGAYDAPSRRLDVLDIKDLDEC